MKRYGNLFEKTVDFNQLVKCAYKAAKGKLCTKQATSFLFRVEPNVLQLQREILAGSYRPQPYRMFIVNDPKTRLIAAADFRDRVVHHSVCNLVEPIFEKFSIHDSYACRKEKGTHRALARAQYFCQKYRCFLKNDIHKFFDSIDHRTIKALLRRSILADAHMWAGE